jgi:hypothetical protein
MPVSGASCPFTPDAFYGDSNSCYNTCVSNGYDPGLCSQCCGLVY